MKQRHLSLGGRSTIRVVGTTALLAVICVACGTSDDTTTATTQPGESTALAEPGSAAPSTIAADGAVSGGEQGTASPAAESPDENDADATDDGPVMNDSTGVNPALFFEGALTEEAALVDCTLSDGAETTCYQLTVAGDPVTYETGPFCPTTIEDDAEAGGIWFDGEGVYDLDGAFVENLDEHYGDENWQLYDEDGNVSVTETAEEFDLAARPDVDPSVQNHCVEGRAEWLENGEPVTSTVLIPVNPGSTASTSTTGGNLGVTLDGVVIAQSAPVDAILSAYTIAAFDDCGGHYNPIDGYHVHGAVGCSESDEIVEEDTAMFAYAMDGVPVFSPLTDATSAELDECNGHETEEHGYHYHANDASQNLVIECFTGAVVAGEDGHDDGAPDGPPNGPPPGQDG